MALNRPDNLFDSMTNEVPGPSGRWIGQEAIPIVPTVVKNVHNNISVQTGEEFSKEFLQDRLPVRRLTVVADTVQDREKKAGINGNQNSQLAYEDLTRILGLRRMDSECASETSEFVSAKGSSKEVDVEAYVDKRSRSNRENGDNGHGLRKAFSDLNCDRTGGTNVPPSYKSESPNSNNINGSGVSDGSQCGKVKFLCSFGGKILPRPSDGRLRYVGGETRIVSIRKNISWDELVKKTSSICNEPHVIKYQLPGEDLDALISVSSDEDLQNMIEEYNGIERQDGSQRLRIFLIPLGESENASLEASTKQQNNQDYQYVAAVNGMVDPSPRAGEEASQVGARTSQFPTEVNSDSNALNPNKFSESLNINVSPTQSPPFSPVPCPQGDSKNIQKKSHGNNSSHKGCNESNCSLVTTQLPPQNSSTNIGRVNPEAVSLMNYHQPSFTQSEQLHGGKFQDHNPSKEFIRPLAVGQNDGEFDIFSHDKQVHKERIFHSEKPSTRPEDPTGLLSDYGDSHQGMPHAFSDSKLQESGRKSAYCSQEGVSASPPLAYAKAQLSLLLNSGPLQETTSQLHGNVNVLNPIQTNLLDDESVGLLDRNLSNSSMSIESMGWNEPTLKGTGDIHNSFQTAKDNLSKSNSTLLDQSEEDSLSLGMVKRHDEKNPFLDQDEKVCEGSLAAAGMECTNNLDRLTPNPSTIFTIGSQERLPVSSGIDLLPLVDGLTEHPKKPQCDNALSDLLPMSQKNAADQDCAMNGKMDGQRSNVLEAMNSEVSSIYPTAGQPHHGINPLGDLLTGLSSDPVLREPTQLHPVASNVISEPMLTTSVNLFQLPLNAGPGISSNLPKSDQVVQNPSQDSAVKREVSLLDMDFVSYPNQNFEKIDFGVSTDLKSNMEDITLVQMTLSSNHYNPSVAVTQYVTDETSGDAISPAATEVDSIVLETDSEDAKTDGGKNEPFSDAMIAEMEASIYGLQIIRNADLEELRELGSGTYGTVYHGKWRGSDVAIKRIKKSCFSGRSSEQERLTKDFWREAQILSNLHHPNVVAFYGVVPDGTGGTLATVTEYMVNGSLRHVLLKKDRSLDRRRKLIIAMDAAFGMEYLHSKNIVHFDLKCDNLLVNLRDPQRPICKVGDFGLSRIKRNTLVSGGVRGTLPWMAPELLNGSSSRVSEKVDVFSFGISMWEILTGEEPYANMHCGAIIGGIVKNTLRPPIPERCDPNWRKLMEECWSPEPESRPSFTEITNRLRSMSIALQAKAQNNTTRVAKA